MHERGEHLHEQLEHVRMLFVGLGDGHAFLDEALLHHVLVKREGTDVVGRRVVREDASRSQQVHCETLVALVRTGHRRLHQ